MATSNDLGATWSIPVVVVSDGVAPQLLQLSSGKIMLTVGRRITNIGIEAFVSNDAGSTWSSGLWLYRNDGSYDTGYSSNIQLSNGNIVTAFYDVSLGTLKSIYSESYLTGNTGVVAPTKLVTMFEGMEDGTLNNFDLLLCSDTLSTSTSIVHTGTYSLFVNDTDTITGTRAWRLINNGGSSTGKISFWIYVNSLSGGVQFGLSKGRIWGSDIIYWFNIFASDNSLKWYDGSFHALTTPTSIPLNTLTKISIQFDTSAGTASVYVNDESKGSILKWKSGNVTDVLFGTPTSPTGDKFYVDDVYTQQVLTTEPTNSVGNEENCDCSDPTTTESSQEEAIQIPKESSGTYTPIKDSSTDGQNISVTTEPGTFSSDAYFSAQVSTPESTTGILSSPLSASYIAGGEVYATNTVFAGGGSGATILGVKQSCGVNWQVGNIQQLWFKTYPPKGSDKPPAIIIPELQLYPSIVALSYTDIDLISPGNPTRPFLASTFKLAHSLDGAMWYILPTSVVDTVNQTVAALHKIGGFYMIVSGCQVSPLRTSSLNLWATDTLYITDIDGQSITPTKRVEKQPLNSKDSNTYTPQETSLFQKISNFIKGLF